MQALRRNIPALLILVAILVGLEVFVRAANVKSFIFPAPTAVWNALLENWNEGYRIFPAARVTLTEAFGGLER